MKVNILPIDSQKILRGMKVVENGKAFYDYHEGKRGELLGTSYVCLLPEAGYEKASVKIHGEMLPSIEYKGVPVNVSLIEPTVTAYEDFRSGEIKLNIMAQGIEELSAKKVTLRKGDEA